ncbi:tRNA modification GTPase [Roseimaritima sediminicola]|uniref:tRNA modification GTPase n=1 Tax=Roseimaritima sediminicola TaxID=2662066 RepID=UPI0012983186|nr:GTPase [Roseimaritima sediminicola]
MSDIEDTICAVASAAVGAAQGIVRISGPDSLRILRSVQRGQTDWPQRAPRRVPLEMDLGSPLGTVHGSALLWPTPRSYTGQVAAELHLPGCLPLLDAAVERLIASGARPARPGEFTLRAFLAGRLDLTQAEAVLGVIDADDRRSLDTALEQLAGGLSGPLGRLRADLLDLLSHLEAGLDFVEEDIQFIAPEELDAALCDAQRQLQTIRGQLSRRTSSADLPLVVLRGKPNAGKSRLMNVLSGASAAIVTDVAGTTRDPVHWQANLGRHRVQLADTAGIEAGRDSIERRAQTAGVQTDRRAAVRLICQDALDPAPQAPPTDATPTLFVRTKCDLLAADDAAKDHSASDGWIDTSSLSGQGIDRLREAIAELLDRVLHRDAGSVAGTAARCAASLDEAIAAVEEARSVLHGGGGEELVAAEMRLALSAIGEVTGEVYTDDILDRIFSRFCIGK